MGRIVQRLVLLAVLGLAAYVGSAFVYPDVSALARRNPGETALMKWREAQWAAEGRRKTIVRHWVPISHVSPMLLKAVLIGEDDKFYHHGGFDYAAIEAAFEKDLKAGRFAAGASTISQQLVKNLYLSPRKSVLRKLREAILTWRMEHALTKRRILELYVNVAEWGDGIFGVEAAARHYYGRSARALTGRQAAHLAAVLPNPIRFSPLSHQKYVAFRSRLIYSIMLRRGVVIPDFREVMSTPDQPVLPAPGEAADSDNATANATLAPQEASGPGAGPAAPESAAPEPEGAKPSDSEAPAGQAPAKAPAAKAPAAEERGE